MSKKICNCDTRCTCNCGLKFAEAPVLRVGIYPDCLPAPGTVFLYWREDEVLYYFDEWGNEYPIIGKSEGQVQSDWAELDPKSMAYILNKPDIYTKDEINKIISDLKQWIIDNYYDIEDINNMFKNIVVDVKTIDGNDIKGTGNVNIYSDLWQPEF